MTRLIPVTQFLRPHGERRIGGFERPEPIAAKADEIRRAGYQFHAEVLTNGEVSLTIVGPSLHPEMEGEHADVAIAIASNSAEVLEAFDTLVLEFKVPERKS